MRSNTPIMIAALSVYITYQTQNEGGIFMELSEWRRRVNQQEI